MICFTWWGLTQYAARAIEAFNKVSKESVCVVATRPQSSPVKGMERILTCPIVWVEENDTDYLPQLPELPRVIFVSNWNLPCWKTLERAVKANGGKTIAMVDTNCVCLSDVGGLRLRWSDVKIWLRQLVQAVRFRVKIRSRFDAFFVVGASGAKLMRLYGVPRGKVFQGLYGADSSLFTNGIPLAERPKKIIYVGQFIERKNVRRLVQAFARLVSRYPDWSLDLYGAGTLASELNQAISQCVLSNFGESGLNNQGICLHPFCQPEQLPSKYQLARIFVLPSFEEHWGVVVHEAALCGCCLALSDRVGAADDFATVENAARFDPQSVVAMTHALEHLMEFDGDELERAQAKSVELAQNFGLHRFVKSATEICSQV